MKKWPSSAMPVNSRREAQPIVSLVERRQPDAVKVDVAGDALVLRVDPAGLVEVCRLLRDEPQLDFDLLVAQTAVDWIDWLDVVYVVRSTQLGHELVFTVQLEGDDAEVPSLEQIWPAAIWMEREVYDLSGVRFADHPDLRRILTWDEYEGHPLRKDFGLGEGQRDYDQVPPGYKKVGEQ